MMNVNASVETKLNAAGSKSGGLTSVRASGALSKRQPFAHGSDTGQIDTFWGSTIEIPASANYSIDLTDLINDVNEAFAFQVVRAVSIATDRAITIGGGADSFEAFDGIDIGAGGIFTWASPPGTSVSTGTHLLRLSNNDSENVANVDIIILGVMQP